MFLNQLSQDLRTPLNVVIAYSKMIRDGLLGEVSPSQEKAIQQVIKHSYGVLSIITSLLQSTTNGGLESAVAGVDSSETAAIAESS
jgi:K+-sensing histidine kinase KdpD